MCIFIMIACNMHNLIRRYAVKFFILTFIIFCSFFAQANTSLIDAIKNKTYSNEKLVVAIRGGNLNLSARDPLRNTALHWAYFTDNQAVIDALLEAGARTDVKNSKGKNPKELSPQAMANQTHDTYDLKKEPPSNTSTPLRNSTSDTFSDLISEIKANNLNEVLRHLAFSTLDQEYLDRALYTAIDMETVNQEIVLALIIKGANPNTQSGYRSSLLIAVQKHDKQTVSDLLSTKRINVDVPNGSEHPTTALYTASRNNDIEIMSLLLDAGADPNNNSTYEGRLPFISAIINKSIEAIFLLLDAGADPSKTTKYGQTALDVAIEKINLPLVSRLANAEMYVHSNLSFIKAMRAALQSTDDTQRDTSIETILRIFHIVHQKKLSNAQYVVPETTNKIDKLISLFAKVYQRKKENTVLYIAYGEKSILQTLLQNVVVTIDELWWEIMTRPHRKDKPDMNVNMIDAMLSTKNISNINLQDREGNTALHRMLTGASFDSLPALEMLLKNGADPNIENKRGFRALSLVRDPDLRSILVRYGAVPNEWSVFWSKEVLQNTLDNSYRVSSMLFLFEQAGTLNAKDSLGKTILHEFIVGQYDMNYMISELIRKGVDPTIKDNNGNTAFDLASRHNLAAKTILTRLTRNETDATTSSCQKAMTN